MTLVECWIVEGIKLTVSVAAKISSELIDVAEIHSAPVDARNTV